MARTWRTVLAGSWSLGLVGILAAGCGGGATGESQATGSGIDTLSETASTSGGTTSGTSGDSSDADGCDDGCWAPPMCGEPCGNPGCCCACGNGSDCMLVEDDRWGIRTCADGWCYEVTQVCDEGSTCVYTEDGQTGPACLEDLDCAALQAAYAAAASQLGSSCHESRPCEVLAGHCEIGLGSACGFVTGDPALYEAQVQRIAGRFVELGCEQAIDCKCPPQPTVECVYPGGSGTGQCEPV